MNFLSLVEDVGGCVEVGREKKLTGQGDGVLGAIWFFAITSSCLGSYGGKIQTIILICFVIVVAFEEHKV